MLLGTMLSARELWEWLAGFAAAALAFATGVLGIQWGRRP
jgi:hypothetical protein